ncbi:MAG TPA: hypothetical protein VMA13_12715, partial [Candidatus Saccharimonadales bacterium]|nr:hypothetical protein [Candidatus Saccharimonadales bacterium]
MRTKYPYLPVFTFVALATVSLSRAQMTVTPDRPDGIYKVGDTVYWTIEWKGESNPPSAHYVLKSGGLKVVGQGGLNFSNDVAGIETTFSALGTMLVVVQWPPENDANRALG